jgi:peptidoglycan-associated lipoprotein
MARLTTTIIVLTALLGTASCATHRQPLPPPPSAAPTPPPPPPTGDGIIPGTRADFERSVTSDTVHFALDQYDLDPEARAILDSQLAWLLKFPNVPVSIEGHCDERGTREYNLALGDRRANSAKNYLVAHGVAASRISTISYGKEKPIALGSDEASWAQNRRAVTVVLN